MSDRHDRDATQIIDMARKSAGCDADGQLLLWVSGMLKLAELRGRDRGFAEAKAEVLAEFDKFFPKTKGEAA